MGTASDWSKPMPYGCSCGLRVSRVLIQSGIENLRFPQFHYNLLCAISLPTHSSPLPNGLYEFNIWTTIRGSGQETIQIQNTNMNYEN